MNSKTDKLRKSPLMIVLGFVIWLGLIWKYESFFMPLYNMMDSSITKLLVVFAVLWINVVWYYGVFHLLNVLFSIFSKPIPIINLPQINQSDSVAILYTTCNDFYWEAVESCINQDYPYFNLFILDDSTDTDKQAEVDTFCRKHYNLCTLVRRKDKRGFKAGNLNHALKTVAGNHKYFAVVDADEILPKNFLSKIVPSFSIDEQIGFIQADHKYRKSNISNFSSDMSKDVDLHWGLFLPARNKYGFVMFYGHGAVIRTDVWKKVGGFPEIVSEDIAFAAKARELGFYGIFQKNIVAEEAFPNAYSGFLRREIKVVKGSLQFMLGPARSFFKSRNVTITEKIDLLASVSILFLPIIFICFLMVANVVLPLVIASHDTTNYFFRGMKETGSLPRLEAFGARISDLWSWDFYLLTIITILAPLIYQIRILQQYPIRMVRYVAQSTTIFLSIIPSIAWEMICYLIGKRVEFLPTGDSIKWKIHQKPSREFISLSIGVILVVFSLLTWNLALLTVALSFVLHPILLRTGFKSSVLQFAILVPFLFFISVFGSIPFLLIGISGMLTVAMPAHH